MLRYVVVLCAVVGASMAAVGIAPLEPKPEKFRDLEGCYVKQLDRVIPFGKTVPSTTQCMEYSCSGDSVGFTSCGVVLTAPPCRVVEDTHKLYPDCCPETVCPEVSKNEIH